MQKAIDLPEPVKAMPIMSRPDSATGNTYFLLVKLGQITQMGSYLDLYRKVGGDWRIAERNVVLHFMADTPG